MISEPRSTTSSATTSAGFSTMPAATSVRPPAVLGWACRRFTASLRGHRRFEPIRRSSSVGRGSSFPDGIPLGKLLEELTKALWSRSRMAPKTEALTPGKVGLVQVGEHSAETVADRAIEDFGGLGPGVEGEFTRLDRCTEGLAPQALAAFRGNSLEESNAERDARGCDRIVPAGKHHRLNVATRPPQDEATPSGTGPGLRDKTRS